MIKRVINTNISLEDAFSNLIEQSVGNILIQKGIENGDSSPITDLGDVKKKGSSGEVVDVRGGTCSIKTGNGEIISVTTGNGIYDSVLQINSDISFDYDENGNAYLLNTAQFPEQTQLLANIIELNANDNINLAILNDNEIKSRIIMKDDGIEIGMNSQNLGGLIIIEKLTEKLNELVDAINQLVKQYQTHTHAVTVVGSPTGPATTPFPPIFNKFIQNQYENKNVTHS
jgi:hypothetical protein